MALGNQIRLLRKRAGLTLEQLSEMSGVEIGTINALENRDSVRSKYAGPLAKAFGLTIEQLESAETDFIDGEFRRVNDPEIPRIPIAKKEEHDAIEEVVRLMREMNDAGKWILVGEARQVLLQHRENKQAASCQ